MNNAQIINDLIMKCAEYKKDAEYLAGERDYWKQQAQRDDSVASGCDTYTFKMRDGEDDVVITKEADSREKLEADVRHFANHWAYDDYLSDETVKEMRVECMSELSKLLDRQAAITERECDTASWKANYRHMMKQRDELQKKVDTLEAELNRTCTLAYDGKWLTCSECGESLQWFGVRTVYKAGTQERALGVEGVKYCAFCGARIEDGDAE